MKVLRVKAKALLITIVIILIVTMIISSLILFYYQQEQLWNNTCIELQLKENVDAGLKIALTDDFPVISIDDTGQVVDVFSDNENLIQINKQYWGVYMIISAVSKKNHLLKKKALLVGQVLSDSLDALYVADRKSPLILSGVTKITGDCRISKWGYRSSSFEEQKTVKEHFIDANISESSEKLPEIDSVKHGYIFEEITDVDKRLRLVPSERSDTLTNSFFENVIFIYSKNKIELRQTSLKGKIIVYSESAIAIDRTAILEDVILVAPNVFTGDYVKGSFQAFATDTIIVGKHNSLRYPTALVLVTNNRKIDNAYFRVDSNSNVLGSIITWKMGNTELKTDLVATSKLTGNLYSNGLVSTQGVLYGQAIVEQFYLKMPRGFFFNYLNDAVINRKMLSKEFVSHLLMQKQEKKKIVKWLH